MREQLFNVTVDSFCGKKNKDNLGFTNPDDYKRVLYSHTHYMATKQLENHLRSVANIFKSASKKDSSTKNFREWKALERAEDNKLRTRWYRLFQIHTRVKALTKEMLPLAEAITDVFDFKAIYRLAKPELKFGLSSALFVDGEFAGFTLVSARPHPFDSDQLNARVELILLRKDLRNKGYGRMLLNDTERRLALKNKLKHSTIKLMAEIAEDNKMSCRLFASQKFQQVEVKTSKLNPGTYFEYVKLL